MIECQISAQELIKNPKNVESVKDNLNDILKSNVDPNKDENVSQEDTSKEIRNKHKYRVPKNHPISNIVGNINECVATMRQSRLNEMGFVCYTSQLKPKNVKEALRDESWTITLQEELNQFIRNDVWYLVSRPKDKYVIGTKWILKNKQDENGVNVRNKARLVAQG